MVVIEGREREKKCSRAGERAERTSRRQPSNQKREDRFLVGTWLSTIFLSASPTISLKVYSMLQALGTKGEDTAGDA